MSEAFITRRTHTSDPHFQLLVSHLDHELWVELKEDQATYDPHNKLPDISTALVVYDNDVPIAIGCFKEYDKDTIEVKRMFVEKKFRGSGISKLVLNHLEQWAAEMGYHYAVLETSIHFATARSLYEKSGYTIISNYGPYKDLPESVCMKKNLVKNI
jgi:putative acetyltransferase